MALPLGKLTILVGAGIFGSVLAKEGRLPNVSDLFSGAYKIVWKQISKSNSSPSSAKPQNDSLWAQVNSLQQELQLLASSRPVAIITSTGSAGASRCAVIIVVVGIAYGYVWWKGWKLPDLMFATRRSLSDACTTVAKQLEDVYTDISATNQHLSSRIDRVDCNFDENGEHISITREEVFAIHGQMKVTGDQVQSFKHAFRDLETKITTLEGTQDITLEGIRTLVHVVHSVENRATKEHIQGGPSNSSRLFLESSEMSPSTSGSSTPKSSVEQLSPTACIPARMVQRPLQTAAFVSGLKDICGISDAIGTAGSLEVSNGVRVTEDTNNGLPNSALFGRKFSGSGTSFLTRTRSAMQSLK